MENIAMGQISDTSEEYHSRAEYIGSSSLKAMVISPGHFYEAWTGPKKESKAFDEGAVVHAALLEQNLNQFVRRPDDLDLRTKVGKERMVEITEGGIKRMIDAAVYDSLYRRISTFVDSTETMKKFDGAKIEQSFYVRDPETNLLIKARPDLYKPGVISELKTTQNMKMFEKQVWNLGYFIQCGFYSLVTELVTGTETREFNFIAQEKTAPYGVKVFYFDRSTVAFCKNKARELLNRAAVCIHENSFPIYDDVSTQIQIPNWVLSNEFSFGEEEAV